ncbi:hypothetical protein BKA69DRAFT_361650 [Paraphysoderma sedebokerense]|nr:hypothetical protein BKA69DRAFT_361650 [Paraphysoderma sedebokerense]
MGVRRSRSGSSSSIDRKSFKRSESPHVPRQFFKLPELVTKGGGIDMRLKNRKSKKSKALLSNYPDDLDNIEEVEKQYHPSNLKYDRELENDEEDGAKNYLKNVARSLRPVESDEEDFTIPRKRRSSSVPNLHHSSLYVFKDPNGRPDQSDIPLNVENYPTLRRVNSSSYLQVSKWRQNAWMRRLMSELEEEGHTEIVRSVEEKMSVMVELLDKVETFSDELTIKLESFREIYESRYNDLKTLEEYINTLSQMQDTIKSRFDHSEVSQSRQLYKISNIEEKLVETEEITNTLKNKIQILREWIKEEEETGWTGIGGGMLIGLFLFSV